MSNELQALALEVAEALCKRAEPQIASFSMTLRIGTQFLEKRRSVGLRKPVLGLGYRVENSGNASYGRYMPVGEKDSYAT
jgi:hypothetical protein